MDSLVTMIVDLLRNKEESAAVHRGEVRTKAPASQIPVAGAGPRAQEPKHGGRTYEDLINEASR